MEGFDTQSPLITRTTSPGSRTGGDPNRCTLGTADLSASGKIAPASDGIMSRRAFLSSATAALLSIWAAGMFSGCSPAKATPRRSIHILIGLDYSYSYHEMLPAAVQQTCTLPGRLDPDSDYLTVLRMADITQEIMDEKMPESADNLQELLVDRLKDMHPVPGTLSALFWQDLAHRLSNEQRPTAIVLWSDGDDDSGSPASKEAILEAARQLAANPNIVSVSILGCRPENRETLRTQFASLGDRFHLYDAQEATLEPILSELDQARQQEAH